MIREKLLRPGYVKRNKSTLKKRNDRMSEYQLSVEIDKELLAEEGNNSVSIHEKFEESCREF